MKQFCCPTSWTDIATAIGTVGAVVAALFVYFLPKFFPPRLRVTQAAPHGSPQRMQVVATIDGVQHSREGSARYYHLEVRNARRWTRAHNVRVVFLKLETEINGAWVDTWGGGGIPIQWQHGPQLGNTRTLGPPQLADLFYVAKMDGQPATTFLQLTPLFKPLGVELTYAGACGLRLTVQAQSDEADSARVVATLHWNGQWHDGAQEMAQHVRWSLEPV